jgi:hypothetical protein
MTLYQTFRPIDGVLSKFGRRTESLHLARQRAQKFKGAEVREFGTLTVVWTYGVTLGFDEKTFNRPWWPNEPRKALPPTVKPVRPLPPVPMTCNVARPARRKARK